MPQIFKVNGNTISRVSRGDWLDEPSGAVGLDGATPRLRWVRHIWSADVLSAANFNTLYALEGQQVSLTTVNYSNRNAADYAAYYGALCSRVEGQHQGNVFIGVTAEFMVRL